VLSTIVTPSLNTLQVFALIALILFLVAGLMSLVAGASRFVMLVLCLGLASVAVSLLFGA
jgi:hypothetical protein